MLAGCSTPLLARLAPMVGCSTRLLARLAPRRGAVRRLSVAMPRTDPEARLAALGLELPPLPTPKGSYVPASRLGNTLFLAGHIPTRVDGSLVVGRVGETVTEADARDAARLVALNILATLRHEVGLENVVQVHKLVAFVNCVDDFTNQPAVINGCSDLLHDVLGDAGVHARSAVGTNALPLGIPVEIEAIVEVAPHSP